jgi:hypothetical protein
MDSYVVLTEILQNTLEEVERLGQLSADDPALRAVKTTLMRSMTELSIMRSSGARLDTVEATQPLLDIPPVRNFD